MANLQVKLEQMDQFDPCLQGRLQDVGVAMSAGAMPLIGQDAEMSLSTDATAGETQPVPPRAQRGTT